MTRQWFDASGELIGQEETEDSEGCIFQYKFDANFNEFDLVKAELKSGEHENIREGRKTTKNILLISLLIFLLLSAFCVSRNSSQTDSSKPTSTIQAL